MRKFLLASAALLGAASAAQAQVTMNPTPNTAMTGFGNLAPTPAPGQLIVRLNGAFVWYGAFTSDGDANAQYWANSATAPTTAAWFATGTGFRGPADPITGIRPIITPVSSVNPVTGAVIAPTIANGGLPAGAITVTTFLRPRQGTPAGFTLNNIGGTVAGVNVAPQRIHAKTDQGFSMGSYIRLYPGFDGVAANGLKYGAAGEIRQDVSGRGAGGAFGGISANNPGRSTLYWRRAYGYFGTDQLGTIRVGSIDGPSNLLSTGKNYFNDAGYNGDLPSFKMSNVGPTWPFMDIGNLYIVNKVVYLSPQFAGFDFGASWAPTNNSLSNTNGCSLGLASTGCDRLSSISTTISATGGSSNETRAHRDTTEIFARYRGTFGGVGLSAFGGWIGSGHVNSNNQFGRTAGYDGLSIGLGGAQISYAGFALGGMIQGGNTNLQYALKPSGAPDALAWYLSATYTSGPMVVGASYFEHTYAGAFIPGTPAIGGNQINTNNNLGGVGRERKDRGFAAGGTYAVAPGFAVYLSYLWGDRHQRGVNQLTGETVVTGSGAGAAGLFKNTTTHQAISIGTAFRW